MYSRSTVPGTQPLPPPPVSRPSSLSLKGDKVAAAPQTKRPIHNARKPSGLVVDLTGNGSGGGGGGGGAQQHKSLSAGLVEGGGVQLSPLPPHVAGPASAGGLDGIHKTIASQQSSRGVVPGTPTSAITETQSQSKTQVPFPPRPCQKAESWVASRPIESRTDSIPNEKTESQQASSDSPMEARKYPQGRKIPHRTHADTYQPSLLTTLTTDCADYYPWRGTDLEDQLSEHIVKSGFSNKPLVSNETNTARPSLWNHLKNKQGLSTLSQVFVSVLEKRQNAGRLTAHSAFKPPPRIVFTAGRREQWLHELANPALNLKRFSKTIPHGIVGKGLLEVCMSNNIPITRAVWLAKCVGSNELRSLKRKGAAALAGNEHKWIREWTTNVEQWIEAVLSLCGEEGWSAKIHYTTRLAATLFNEQLLEQEHFLAWILSSFEGSSIDRLPFWLLMIQMYWKHLVISRRRGKKLAEAIFAWLQTTCEEETAHVLQPLCLRLQQLLITLSVAHKGCMILPAVWGRYKALLSNCVQSVKSPSLEDAIRDLNIRNQRLAKSSAAGASTSPESHVFQILDAWNAQTQFDQIYDTLASTLPDHRRLAQLVIRWASSIYRDGSYRAYLASRLLRKLYLQGLDVDTILIEFITHTSASHDIDYALVFKLINELIRSQHFSAAGFFQSLIATGTFSAPLQVTELHAMSMMSPLMLDDMSAEVRLALLAISLPRHCLSENMKMLKQMFLADAGMNSSAEDATCERAIEIVDMRSANSAPSGSDRVNINPLPLTLRSTISHHIRTQTQAGIAAASETSEHKLSPLNLVHTFEVARDFLEQLDDFPVLADVLGMSTAVADAESLSRVIECLHMHIDAFAAIGALVPLFKTIFERYQYLRGTEVLCKDVIKAARDLASALGLEKIILHQLDADLARCTHRDAAAMYSPASDSATEVAQIGADTDDDIERVLNSGTSMEEQIMTRIFTRIVSRLTKRDQSQLQKIGSWLARLQAFDAPTFGGLLSEWLSTLMFSSRQSALALLPVLVGSGCISLDTFIQGVEDSRSGLSTKEDRLISMAVMEAIFTPTPRVDLLGASIVYKVRLCQQQYVLCSQVQIFKLLKHITTNSIEEDVAIQDRLLTLLDQPMFASFLKKCITTRTQLLLDFISPSAPGKNDAATSGTWRLLERLVGPSGRSSMLNDVQSQDDILTLSQGLAADSVDDKIPRLIAMADDLSLPYCEALLLALQSESAIQQSSAASADALYKAINTAAERSDTVWMELAKKLDKESLTKTRQAAEAQLLDSLPTTDATPRSDEASASVTDAIQKLLLIIECTKPSASPQLASKMLVAVTEKLRLLLDVLSPVSGPSSAQPPIPSEPVTPTLPIEDVCAYMTAILRLALSYRTSNAASFKSSADLLSLLTTLASLLDHPKLQLYAAAMEYIFDIMTVFSDDLNDEQRKQISKTELTKTNGARLSFLFGSSVSSDSWLGLVTSSTPAPPITPIGSRPPPLTRQPSTSSFARPQPSPTAARPQPLSAAQQQQPKTFNPPVPYTLRRWEIIDLGGSVQSTGGGSAVQQTIAPAINDTAISLTLFGARRVN